MNEEFLEISVSELSTLVEKYGVLNNLKKLDLSQKVDDNNVKELEKIIPNLPNMEELSFCACLKLSHLPNNIHQLSQLKILDLAECESLKELPENIMQLKELQILNLFDCKTLSSLPENIGLLKNLKALNISFTDIKKLPETMGELQNLEYLSIKLNNLSSFPNSMKNLKKLTKFGILIDEEIHIHLLNETVKLLPHIEVLNFIASEFLVKLPNSVFRLKSLRRILAVDTNLHISPTDKKKLPSNCEIIFDYQQSQQIQEEEGMFYD